MLEVLTIVALVALAAGTVAFTIISRIEGQVYGRDLDAGRPKRLRGRAYIEHHLGKTRTAGRWGWHYSGRTFYRFAWVWWRVPARWSMRAFRIVLLDKQVNGG